MSSPAPLREFRRGVKPATVSCLTFSLDSNWLGCSSDRGTVHVFQTRGPAEDYATTGRTMQMLPRLASAPPRLHLYAQIRGVPRPLACAFVRNKERTVAVAGTDEDGNGCLLLAEFDQPPGPPSGGGGPDGLGDGADGSEARQLGYHFIFKRKSPVG